MEDYVADWVTGVLYDFQQSIEGVAELLAQSLTTDANGNTRAMWTFVETVHGILNPVCYTIMVIFFLIEFLKLSMKIDMMKWEYIFKVLIKFVVAKACVDFGGTLLDAIYSTCAEWIVSLGDSAYDPAIYETITEKINLGIADMGFWDTIGFVITSILPCIVLIVCGWVVKAIAYGRLIEIYILLACMPISFAFILDGEGHSNITKKYVLNFIGVCLQGLLMIIACSLFQYIMADNITAMSNTDSVTELIMSMVFSGIILVLSISKCGQWGKQLVNAM